jgi:hypothetical protein
MRRNLKGARVDKLESVEKMFHTLKAYVEGKSIALLGSAPGRFEFRHNHDLIASVNASHVGFGLKEVDILFLNSYSMRLGGKNKELRFLKKPAIDAISCGLAVIIDPIDIGSTIRLNCKSRIVVGREERNLFLSLCSGIPFSPEALGRHVPSTGIQAALALRAANPKMLTLYGFSLSHGHILGPEFHNRHIELDEELLSEFDVQAPI